MSSRTPSSQAPIQFAGAGAGAWRYRRRHRKRKADLSAGAPGEGSLLVANTAASESQSELILSELSLDPVFVSTGSVGDDTTTSFPNMPSTSLVDSALSLPRIALPTLPDGTFGLEPEPSLPGTAWEVTLEEALLVRVPSRSSPTLVMPGEWIPPPTTDRSPLLMPERPAGASSIGDIELESSELEPMASLERQEDLGELESSELEELDLDFPPLESPAAADIVTELHLSESAPSPQRKVDSEPTFRTSTMRSQSSPRPPIRRRPEEFSSPTLRAVASTLGSGVKAAQRSERVSTVSLRPDRTGSETNDRVFVEFGDPGAGRKEGPPEELGEDSVWLEFGDPGIAEVTTQRELVPEAGRDTPDVLADGGAVRVDLSLGTRETPNLDEQRASVVATQWPQIPAERDSTSGAADLRSYATEAGEGKGGFTPLEDEQTDKGPTLEEQITEGGWRDKFGPPAEGAD